MMGLGYLGLSHNSKALDFFDDVLVQDTNHQGALLHKKLGKNFNELVQI